MQRNALEVWNEIPNEYKKFVKEVLQKRNKKSSSQYLRNWRFLLEAPWDNAKIQTQQNWTNLNSATICFVHWETLGLSFLYKWTSVIFFFFFLFLCIFLSFLWYISSFLFYFQCAVSVQLAFAICRSKEFLVNMYENIKIKVWSEVKVSMLGNVWSPTKEALDC